jgi:hypothetical protein
MVRAARASPRLKIALVVGIVVVVGLLLARLHEWSHVPTFEGYGLRDITNALEAYVLTYQGDLPGSWDDIMDAGMAIPSEEDGNLVTIRTELIPYSHHPTASDFLVDIRNYAVSFGTKAEDITLRDSEVLGPAGESLMLIAPLGKSRMDKDAYRKCSMRIARAMKEGVRLRDEAYRRSKFRLDADRNAEQ